MKMTLALAVLVLAGTASAVPFWEDPLVNSENRLPSRTRAMPLASGEAAFTDALEFETPYVKSLNGMWKIRWSGTAQNLRTDFVTTDFDDANWQTVEVPSCLELRGFGVPIYTNVEYPHGKTPPVAEERNNPVADYRTHFTLPAEWKGRRVVLRFDGIAAAGRVWLNGKYVGYTEDSKLTAEFDVTTFLDLRPSTSNLLCVQVVKWPDGAFLEDQDMFRYHGIIRDVSLVAEPKDGVRDLVVKTIPTEGLEKWKLEVKVEGQGQRRTTVSLYDADKKKVGDLTPLSTSTYSLHLASPRLWSAEDPYLYTLIIRHGDDIRAQRVGFKHVEIRGNVFYVNGAKVKLHGVNRHETNPYDGRTVTRADMIRDATMMKQANIDTVRTSHYPDHPLWYDICDRYGIYVVAEANVEAHGICWNYSKSSVLLGCKYEWEKPIVERNVNQVLQLRNHPSIVMWSLGNESGAGPNFVAARAAVKELDDRPVHYECGNEAMDVDSTMYSSVEKVHMRGEFGAGRTNSCDISGYGDAFGRRHSATKPYFMCEYAHAMNNAVGNLQEYWDEFYAYDSHIGGCIWDWVDQAIWKTLDRLDENGEPIRHLAFGGDFDDRPNLAGFCCNGLIDAERHWTAKLDEVKYVFAPIRLKDYSLDGQVTLVNYARFTSSDAYDGTWELLKNGTPVASGAFAVPAVAPASERRITLPAPKLPRDRAEYVVNYRFALKADTLWARKGYVVAADQFVLSGPAPADLPQASGVLAVGEDDKTVTVTGEKFKAVFCRATGTLASLAYDGVEMLAKGNLVRGAGSSRISGPHFTCAHAFTDNTNFLREPFFWAGLTQLHYTCDGLEVARDGADVVLVASVTVAGARRAGFTHKATFRVTPVGVITVRNEVDPVSVADLPQLPREGFTLTMGDAFENVEWYGRGPRENYIDRCHGSFLGKWKNTVTGLAERYTRPQDTANVTEVRSYAVTDDKGRGLVFTAERPFAVRVLRNTWEELEFARHRPGWERVYNVKPPRKEVLVDIDFLQVGLGGASCGPATLDKYTFTNESRTFTYTIAPHVP